MNVTALSREDLVSEMLAPLPPTFAAGALRVSDADPFQILVFRILRRLRSLRRSPTCE